MAPSFPAGVLLDARVGFMEHEVMQFCGCFGLDLIHPGQHDEVDGIDGERRSSVASCSQLHLRFMAPWYETFEL
jgi:hypothetical protein